MTAKRFLKLIHLSGTLLFLASIAYIVILSLRANAVSWWVIFSLSGHTVLLGFLLISVYLFALFRGVSDSPQYEEHPLTSSGYYMLLYVCSPLLGLAAGIYAMAGGETTRDFFLGVSYGTFGATFVGWVIVDPLVGFIESLMPASRAHRAERLEQARAEKAKQEESKRLLLEQIILAEESSRKKWKDELAEHAEKLALLLTGQSSDEDPKEVAASIGVKAWQTGGLSCMKFLHEMALERCVNDDNSEVVDRLPLWWDGIGRWQNTSIA